MPNLLNFERPRPNIKPKPPEQLTLLPEPRPPVLHRAVVSINRGKTTLTAPAVRVRKSLQEAIDYDLLTPTQQLRWDMGMYGSIELKTIRGYQYYYLRWLDPESKKYRSNYLGKTWDKAIEKLRKLTGYQI
jgi:hypothetical protein